MSRGHAILINLTSNLPFVFNLNPEELDSTKKINYVVAPNIGGSHKRRYFSGFESKEVEFRAILIDKQNPLGVQNYLAYFEQLRQPDPGLFGVAASFFGNENYPPPRVLFQWGSSMIPVVWDVLDIDIKETHFWDGHVRGVAGIPWRAEVTFSFALVEDHPLNKANLIAEKASYVLGSAESVLVEGLHKGLNRRKDAPYQKKGGNQPGTAVVTPGGSRY